MLRRPHPEAGGFTLIELMITIVVVAIGVALAVPTWESVVQKRNLTSAAEEVAALVNFAQSEAIKRNEQVFVSMERNGGNWCVGAAGSAIGQCDCQLAAGEASACEIDGQLRAVTQAGFEGFSADGSWADGVADADFFFIFDPVRGLKLAEDGSTDSDPNSISLLSNNDKFSLRVDVSVTGRVKVCNPDADKKVAGFRPC